MAMATFYVSPNKMAEYRQTLALFAKAAPSLHCIRSHYYPDRSGVCDLMGTKEQEEVFVLVNRGGDTIKVGRQGMQVVANVVDITGADQWYDHLKEQKRTHRERVAVDVAKREEERKQALRTVVLRRRALTTILKS